MRGINYIPDMMTFPLTSPPKSAGIYALTNKRSGQVYIGQSTDLRRRYAEWKGVFNNGVGIKSAALLRAVQDSCPEEWLFTVLAEVPAERLNEAERIAVLRAEAVRPGRVLNTKPMPMPPTDVGIGRQCVSESTIIGLDGQPITQREAAQALSVTKQAVKKRLQHYRRKGVFTVYLADWMTKRGKTPGIETTS